MVCFFEELYARKINFEIFLNSKGEQKAAREKKIEASEVLWSTARVMEVSLESSFQPTIQLYIIFPVLVSYRQNLIEETQVSQKNKKFP